jgi:arsenate reductase-like glutaredoxin family protein
VLERNYAKEPLTRNEVAAIVAAVGEVAPLINTRHKVAKERGWKTKPPAASTFVKAVLEEPNLIRRPVLVAGKRVVIGKDLDAVRALLDG